ncbi:MAG: ketoacyl-ACP synthase III [Oscillospiraceae bacterium]|jgi:3-oxoacyl-[acyl-carrier-protein] synthase-3|nr:ketoacyl-ACP synthase III [Oscillospiraceae bacterium]MCI8877457.1 ketoacyl-ACP synthase III [Oscillospiraceae bacterium]
MSGIKIRGTGRGLPERVLTNDDLAKKVDTSDQWIVSRTGIRQRRLCTEETHADLCAAAARAALERGGIRPEELGVCIVATMTPDTLVPSAACTMQRALGLSCDTLCFDLNAACTGFLYALHTAECLLAAAPRKYGLVIGADVFSRVLDWSDRSTCILFGDGAGAAVVEWRAEWPSAGAVLGCAGNDGLLRCPAGGTLSMEGQQVFRFALEAVPWCIAQVLERQGVTAEAVDLFVFHQANARIIDLVAKKYGIPPEKYYKNIQRYGNTSAASIPIALSELEEAGRLPAGTRAMLVGFGGGLTWGGALVEIA